MYEIGLDTSLISDYNRSSTKSDSGDDAAMKDIHTNPTNAQKPSDTDALTPYMSSSLREFNRLYKEFNEIYHLAARKLGLSDSAFDILYTICEIGDSCTQRDVCSATFIPKQTINSSIRNLEKEGYLTLSPGKGRSMHMHLTESGHRLLQRTIYPVVEAENMAFSKLTASECDLLLTLQNKYIEALRGRIQDL